MIPSTVTPDAAVRPVGAFCEERSLHPVADFGGVAP